MKDFLVEVFEAIELKQQNEKLRKMFDLQVKLIVALQLENEKLRNKINKNEVPTI
jgi:regulator of replication initiation timing